MLYTKRIEMNSHSIEQSLYKIEEERPISIQLIGSDVIALKKSFDFLSSYKFDVLDINAGCPSKRAIRAKEGGYLLQDIDLLNSIINVAIKYSPKPVSLKIRTGFNHSNIQNSLINVLKNSGIVYLTIHGREVKDKFDNSLLNLKAIKEMKELLNIPIIGNGDIDNPISAKKFLEYTNVDALMIGRGSMGNPGIFDQIEKYLVKSELKMFENNLKQMEDYGILYEKILDNFLVGYPKLPYSPENYKFIELKRNLIWLTKSIPNSTNIRIIIAHTKNLYDLKQKLVEIYH
jgi:tRNA-dihydrouridine synthase